ncbi:MAG: hypothetical protein FD134_528 [Gallionellaceae bacterium]|jgi:hypothetical protein|nr:MAG: hypothetical protein FD134_528 [Gallionellaceae bacterium]
MRFKLSNYAIEELGRRGISREMLELVLNAPQQVVPEREGTNAYQSQVDFGGGRTYLLRAIVNDGVDPAVVITVYRGRNVLKYWRKE